MHLFVTYDIPLTKAEAVSKTLDQMASSVLSGASSAAASATSAGIAAWLKQAALRAAGEEGLAENVLSPPRGSIIRNAKQQAERYAPEQSYITGYETIPCIDTSGQSFAVWLNLVYLFPLTLLFVRFFVKSYTRRGAAKNQPKKGQAVKAIKDAAHGTEKEVDKAGKMAENGVDAVAKEINGAAKSNANGKSNGTPRSRKVSDTINKQWERFEKGDESTSESAKAPGATLKKKASQGHDKLKQLWEEGNVSERSKSPSQDRGRSLTASAEESVKETAEEVKQVAQNAVEKLEQHFQAEEKTREAKEESSAPPSQNTDGASETKESPKQPTELEQSWADVAKDAYPKQQQPSTKSSSPSQEEQAADRAPTPTQEKPRSLSPQKQSKLPRPKSREPAADRAPSPAKLEAPKTEEESASAKSSPNKKKKNKPKKLQQGGQTAIPQPSSGANGTKASSSSTSSNNDKTDSRPTSSSGGKDKGDEVKASSLPLAPGAPNTASKTEEKTEEGKKGTNNSVQGADSSSKVEVEQGSGKEALQFRHVDDASATEEKEEGEGESEVKEGVSFAGAVKE